MLKLKKVAVTGGLSSGKSSVCNCFKELGAYVVSADEIVHQILSPETSVGQKVINLIGQDIVVEGQIDRSQIAKKVFDNPIMLKSLESLLHPAVHNEITRQYEEIEKNRAAPLFVAEVPLLFEAKMEVFFDHTIAVVADPKKCLDRFLAGKRVDRAEFEKRNARQLSMAIKEQKADFVIHNDGTLSDLKSQVKKIYNHLINLT